MSTVQLAQIQTQEDLQTPEECTAPEECTGKVLIVDDDPKNRLILRAALEHKGHCIGEAENGEQALQKARSDPPDVVVLDVMMPGLSGYDVCNRLKRDAATAHIPVIMVTALTDRASFLKGMEQGANDFISKPVDIHEVALRVRNAVYSKRLFDQLEEKYKKLKKLEELRDNLVHMIIHDLRQPLTAIMGYLQLFQIQEGEEADASLIQSAISSVHLAADMTNALLDIQRLEEGKLQLNRGEHNLLSLAEKSIKALEPLMNGHTIQFEAVENQAIANCDRDLIQRVIMNLLVNAVNYTPGNGTVSLRIESVDSQVKFSVSDTGIGIPEEFQTAIFDKFGQVESRKSAGKHSSGLGLTFCKMAVEEHGGEIGVESDPGQGSTFWFTLPAAAAGIERG